MKQLDISPAKLTPSLSNQRLQNLTEETQLPISSSIAFHISSPAYSIGKSQRSISMDWSPGPGDYETKRLNPGPAHSFTKSKRSEKSLERSPGPSDYHTEIKPHSYAPLLIGKPKEPSFLNTPGPGAYSISHSQASLSFSIGSSQRFEKNHLTPGPADYNPTLKSRSPVCRIGNAKRKLLGDLIEKISGTPGPSDYSCDYHEHRQAAILIGKSKDKTEVTPGPQSYNAERLILARKPAAYSIGKANRPDVVRNSFPGPADYESSLMGSKQSCSFARSERPGLKSTDSPGPNYTPESSLSRLGGVISQRHTEHTQQSPGPGAYSSPSISPSRAFTIPKSEKSAKIEQSPISPAYYNPVVKVHSPATVFPKARRQELFSPSVSTESFNNGKLGGKYSILGTLKEVKGGTPGPGAYSVDVRSNTPKFSIGRGKRERKVEVSPGPGEYEVGSMNRSCSFKFSKSERKGVIKVKSWLTPDKLARIKALEIESPPKMRSNHYSAIKDAQKVRG